MHFVLMAEKRILHIWMEYLTLTDLSNHFQGCVNDFNTVDISLVEVEVVCDTKVSTSQI